MRKTIPPRPTSGGAMLLPACLWVLLLAGMLATCALVGAWSEPAKAAFPGTNSRIAFEGYRVFDVSPEGNTTEAPELITVSPDGTRMKQLTHASRSSDPDFSPDGTKIAYSGTLNVSDPHEDIYVMARSGKGKKALTDTDDRSELGPAWSPDGTKIAYRKNVRIKNTSIRNHEIFTKSASGTGSVKNVSKDPGSDDSPDWGPRPTASG
jgi:Tol biopolymer transport system component